MQNVVGMKTDAMGYLGVVVMLLYIWLLVWEGIVDCGECIMIANIEQGPGRASGSAKRAKPEKLVRSFVHTPVTRLRTFLCARNTPKRKRRDTACHCRRIACVHVGVHSRECCPCNSASSSSSRSSASSGWWCEGT